jgi:pimeloyl-ACP methyl ester carboxylesterase
MSVAYCEKYPERVERLILISPAGVPDDGGIDISKTQDFRMRRSGPRP